jgi:hypothetical protein
MQDGLSAQVVGPSTIFPRGFLWQVPIWYVAAVGALALSRWLPIWFRLSSAAGLLLAVLIFLCVLGAITTRSFVADQHGIRLGLPSYTRRRGRRRRRPKYLPWHQIEKVRIRRRRRGAVIELILGADAPLALRGFRHGPIWKACRAILLLIPFWYVLRPTGVATPLDGPPRYRVRLRGVTAEGLRSSLRVLAPPNVAIVVLVRKRASVSSATTARRGITGAA